MNSVLGKNIMRFLLLTAAQVLIASNIQLGGLMSPMIYILFIFLLPSSLPAWAVMLLAFGQGMIVDVFANSLGVNAMAATALAFIRVEVIKLVSANEYENDLVPRLAWHGWRPFMIYITMLTFLHHFIYFYVEVGTLTNVFYTFLKVLLSTLFTIFLIVLMELFFRPAQKRKF